VAQEFLSCSKKKILWQGIKVLAARKTNSFVTITREMFVASEIISVRETGRECNNL